MAKTDIKYLTTNRVEVRQKKYCRFKKMGIKYIDYKDPEFLKNFLTNKVNYCHAELPAIQ